MRLIESSPIVSRSMMNRFSGRFTLSLKNSVSLVVKTGPGASYKYDFPSIH